MMASLLKDLAEIGIAVGNNDVKVRVNHCCLQCHVLNTCIVDRWGHFLSMVKITTIGSFIYINNLDISFSIACIVT